MCTDEIQLQSWKSKTKSWRINVLLFLSDTCLTFYNTAPSPSGPSGIHCDLKPDTDNAARVTEAGFYFSAFPSAMLLSDDFHRQQMENTSVQETRG